MSSEQWCLGEISKITNIYEIKPKYKNLKIEVLCNDFAKISKKQWNDTLKKSKFIYQQQKFKYIMELKEVIALKLYLDFDSLQGEYKKCFRSPYNQNQLRLSSFYWWNKILSSTMKKLSNSKPKLHKLRFDHNKLKKGPTQDIDDKKENGENGENGFKSVYHGVSSIMELKNIKLSTSSDHIYKYYGPLSTTRDIFIARSFAGSKGMIIEIQFPNIPNEDIKNGEINTPIDVSYFSSFPEEQEIFCFDQSIYVKNVMLSSEFDAKYLGIGNK